MAAGYIPQWISLSDAIQHLQRVDHATFEQACKALILPLRKGAITSRFRGQEVGGVSAQIEGFSGAVPNGWWYHATVSGDGRVEFAAERHFGRRPPRREIEISRSDLLKIWLEPEAQLGQEPTTAAPEPQTTDASPPGTEPGHPAAKQTMEQAARAFIARAYPNGIPAGKTNKLISGEYTKDTKAPMSERTVRRARK